jgi:hypothetical protein
MSARRLQATAVLTLWLASPAQAREYESKVRIESLQDLYEMERSGELESASVRVLEALCQRPLNINRADRNDLFDLPGVTYAIAGAIVAYRREHGGFESIADLVGIEGMTDDRLASVAPFVTVAGDGDSPVGATSDLHGSAELVSLWRRGFGRGDEEIDGTLERATGPQAALRLSGRGLPHFGAGLLLTHRRRMNAFWDHSRGALVTEGPRDRPDLDDLYLFAGYGSWAVVAGSYQIGFGERLTFDSTDQRDPHGWREINAVSFQYDTGRLDPRDGQYGVAVSLVGADLGEVWVDSTVFLSRQREDLYQYDFNYGLDPWYGENSCDTDGDCPAGYSCGEDGLCRSTRVYDAGDPQSASYRWETIRDAFTEQLVGGNFTINLSERSRVGVTGYRAWTSWNIAEEAQPRFASSAPYPQADSFGAVGLYARGGAGPLDVSAEYARTSGSGDGVFGRVIFDPAGWLELTVFGRYYEPEFENPHSGVRAASDELLGLAARNERGGGGDVTVEPARGWKLVTKLDVWDNPYRPELADNGTSRFVRKGENPIDLYASQRVEVGVTSQETLSAVVDYRNKDLANNGRGQVYGRSDACDEGVEPGCGRGERRKVQLKAGSERIPWAYLWARYTAAWQDVTGRDDSFAFEHQVSGHGRFDAWSGGRLTLHGSFWLNKIGAAAIGRLDDPLIDRSSPAVDVYVEIEQDLADDHLSLVGRYGVLYFVDEDPARFARYHLGSLTLLATF